MYPRVAYVCHIWSLVGSTQYDDLFQPPLIYLSADLGLWFRSLLYWLLFHTRLSVLPHWVVSWSALDMAQQFYSTTSCSLMQDIDAGGVSVVAMMWHALFAWLFMPVYGCLESMIKLYAILYPPRGFHVVNKV